MNVLDLLARLGHWAAARPLHVKVLFSFASSVFLIELAFRRFAPDSRAYARWQHAFEAVGSVWTAVLLSVIYVLSVGPISFFMRLTGKDLLDRGLRGEPSVWHAHEPNPLGPQAAARHQF